MQASGSLKSSLSYASQLSGTNLVSSFTLRNIRWLLLTFKPPPPKTQFLSNHCWGWVGDGIRWITVLGALIGGSVGKESANAGVAEDVSWMKIPWRRAWQPTPAFLPGDSHGQRSLAGYSPWGLKESDMTEATEHTFKVIS